MHKEEIMLELIRRGVFSLTSDYNLVGPKRKNKYTTNCNGYEARSFRFEGKSYTVLVHRIVYRCHKGAIPDGLTVNHKNGNYLDNNPDNLECLSLGDNCLHSLDVLGNRKRLSARISGHKNHNSRFKPDQIKAIRQQYLKEGSFKKIAAKYGISCTSMYKIVRNISYQDEKYGLTLNDKGRQL